MATETFHVQGSEQVVKATSYSDHCFGGECPVVDLVNPYRIEGQNLVMKPMAAKAAAELQKKIRSSCNMCKGKTR